MKLYRPLLALMFVSLLMFGCSKQQAGLDGRIVDGSGNPIANVKVIAKQVKLVKGFEKFETVTTVDGVFRFKGLFPSSEYTIYPIMENAPGSVGVVAKSGAEGQVRTLSEPLVIRYTIMRDGLVTDTKTGLKWAPASEQTMTWEKAQKYAGTVKLGGIDGWRLPTMDELKAIYDKEMPDGCDPSFKIGGNLMWTSQSKGNSTAGTFYFTTGAESWDTKRNDTNAVLAVHQ